MVVIKLNIGKIFFENIKGLLLCGYLLIFTIPLRAMIYGNLPYDNVTFILMVLAVVYAIVFLILWQVGKMYDRRTDDFQNGMMVHAILIRNKQVLQNYNEMKEQYDEFAKNRNKSYRINCFVKGYNYAKNKYNKRLNEEALTDKRIDADVKKMLRSD